MCQHDLTAVQLYVFSETTSDCSCNCVTQDLHLSIKAQYTVCLPVRVCFYNWSRYAPVPIAVLIFYTHYVQPNPINHVCECLISTLLAPLSFSWLSARFIMALACVFDVMLCRGSAALKCVTLLGRRMSWMCGSHSRTVSSAC